eukprot:SAG31_NODE_26621_length_439_cov_0.914706_2_plen_24_part_01
MFGSFQAKSNLEILARDSWVTAG